MMKKPVGFLLLISILASPASADTPEDLDRWFRDGYAALYTQNAWERADEFAQFFTQVISFRSDDGLLQTDVNAFVVDQLEVWRDEGWIGTDVEHLETQLLNKTTAVFDVKWHDRNADGSTENECGWYVADRVDEQWLLSQYITRPCSD